MTKIWVRSALFAGVGTLIALIATLIALIAAILTGCGSQAACQPLYHNGKKVCRVTTGQGHVVEATTDVEQVAELAAAEAKADALESVIEPADAPEGDAPVIVVNEQDNESADAPAPEPLPESDDSNETPKESGGYGAKGWFG